MSRYSIGSIKVGVTFSVYTLSDETKSFLESCSFATVDYRGFAFELADLADIEIEGKDYTDNLPKFLKDAKLDAKTRREITRFLKDSPDGKVAWS